MKARPIIFSGPMIRALLAGAKTRTRRAVKRQPPMDVSDISVGWYHPTHVDRHGEEYPGAEAFGAYSDDGLWGLPCPYGRPGDLLWVRETWAQIEGPVGTPHYHRCLYRADATDNSGARWPSVEPGDPSGDVTWRSPIHMPRWASRLTLRLTDVRVQRVQEIGEEDARAEGITDGGCLSCGESEPCGCANPQPDARDAFAWLWNSINEQRGYPWVIDPWVWALTFDVLPGNVDQYLEAA